MSKMNYPKAKRRDSVTESGTAFRGTNRKAKTTNEQRAKIAAICRELGGREPTFPRMAYDAVLEIDRLQRVLDTRRRMAGS